MNSKVSSPTAVGLTVIAALGRLIPHPANMTPIGASSLFGGALVARPWNYLLPLFTMFVTDLFLGLHDTMLYVYVSIALGVFLAEQFLRKDRALHRVALVSIANATLFFVVTNFGVWMQGALYEKTLAGLLQCYTMALPFFRNMLIGDILFGVGFFGLYALAERSTIQRRIDAWVNQSLTTIQHS